MAEIILRNLARRYGGEAAAVSNVDVTIKSGEFVTLLGPSGCGKSTTLSMIAGLEKPDEGHISIDGTVVYDAAKGVYVDAEQRNLGLVFQSYALWPHMTVRDNISYGLKLRRVGKSELTARVREVADLVEIGEFLDRYPSQLSGGQQQRVALARTLAYRPKVLLLDEPLSNLDAKLRDRAKIWLRHIQSKIGITTVFVTHDQGEALSLSDRIVVMSKGRVEQIGTPREVYQEPQNEFVADFVGASNLFPGLVEAVGEGSIRISVGERSVLSLTTDTSVQVGDRLTVSARPEALSLSLSPQENSIKGRVVERNYVGARTTYTVDAGTQHFRVESAGIGDASEVFIVFPADQCCIFKAAQ